MTFLQAIFLYGLIAVTIPLIIHLLSRRKKNPVLFSSLYFLKLLENRKIRRLKIRQILLLILRMVLIALIVFAFSRPTIISGSGEEYSEGEFISAVIIIDNTLSTSAVKNGNSVYSMIRNRALEILDMLKSGDEIFLFFTGSEENPGDSEAYYDPETIRKQLRSSGYTSMAVSLNDFITDAYDKLEQSTNLNREIYVISDFQKSSLGDEVIPQLNENNRFPVKLFYAAVDIEGMQNAGIQDVTIRNQVFEQNKDIGLRTVINNYSTTAMNDVLVSLYIDGKRIAQKNVNLEPFSQETIEFSFIPGKGGVITGIVEIEDDALSTDNKRYFTIDIPDKLNVLIIHNEQDENEFIEAVFSENFNKLFDPVLVFSDQVNSVDLKRFDVVIYNGYNTWSESDIFRMKNYLTGGGGIVLFPGNNINVDSYNNLPAREFSLPRAEDISGQIYDPGNEGAGFITISEVDFMHPVFFNMFDDPDPVIDYPRIFKSVDLRANSASDVIIGLTNGKPFLTVTNSESGKIAVFSSKPSLTWNTLPVKGLFAPLMHRVVTFLSKSDFMESADIQVGDDISFYYNGSISDLNIISPDGSEYKLTPEIAAESYKINFSETKEPGIYVCADGNEQFRKFAVNADPVESDLSLLDNNRIETIAGTNPLYLIEADSDIETSIRESRSGKEIGDYFLIMILAFIFIEFIIQYEKPDPAFEEQKEETISG
ncbi:BatA domain-containing protein [candidate division KSB1 bacterium]